MSQRPFPYLLSLAHIGGAVWMLQAQPVAAAAAPMKIECPSTLAREAVTSAAPVGWVGHTPRHLVLAGAGMMSGPPDSETFLIPTAQAGPRGRFSSKTWMFEPEGEKWLWCGYGPGNGGAPVVQIGRKLDGKVRMCTMLRTAETKDVGPAYSLKCDLR